MKRYKYLENIFNKSESERLGDMIRKMVILNQGSWENTLPGWFLKEKMEKQMWW